MAALVLVLELAPEPALAPELEHVLEPEHALAPVRAQAPEHAPALAAVTGADASQKLKQKNWRPNNRQFFIPSLFFEKLKWRAMIQLN